MTGLLIFVIIVLALVLALHPANRRPTGLSPKPGEDITDDRDRSRVLSEIQAAEQRESRAQRLTRKLAGSGSVAVSGSVVPLPRPRRFGSRRVPRAQQ